MEKGGTPKVGLVPSKTTTANKKVVKGVAPLSTYFSPIQIMRKEVLGGQAPKEEEFQLILALPKSGVTLESYR